MKVAKKLFPKKAFVRIWLCFSNSRKCEIWYEILWCYGSSENWVWFSILKRLHLIYANQISALFWLSNILHFSLIKSVFAISLERLLILDVLFSMQVLIQMLTLRTGDITIPWDYFYVAKKKNWNKWISKQKLIKDCHYGQNITVLRRKRTTIAHKNHFIKPNLIRWKGYSLLVVFAFNNLAL